VSQNPAIESPGQDAPSEAAVAEAIKIADNITPDTINAVEVNPPAIQSPKVVAKGTFSKFFSMLAYLKTAYSSMPIDCSTTAGDKQARDVRLKLVTLRTRADKVRLSINRAFREQQDACNDEYKMLEDTILPIEKRFDDAIKEAEAARAERKRKEEDEARAQAERITAAIHAIDAAANDLFGMSSADIAVRLQEVQLMELVADDFGARYGEAVTVKDRTIQRLEAAQATALQNEENARKVEADRQRFEAEKAARSRIATINTLADGLDGITIDKMHGRIENIDALVLDTFAPLQDEAQEARDRVRRLLVQAVNAAQDAERRKKEEEQQARVIAARERITLMQMRAAHAVTKTADAIRADIEEVEGLKAADFDPLGAEAAGAQESTLASLRALLGVAEERERAEAERKAVAARAKKVEDNLTALAGTVERLKAEGAESARIHLSAENLRKYTPGAAQFDDRVDEAKVIVADILPKLDSLYNEVHQREQDEAERQRKAKEEADRAEAERQRKEAEDARFTRMQKALAENARKMYDALMDVRAADAFDDLDAELRERIETTLDDILAATR